MPSKKPRYRKKYNQNDKTDSISTLERLDKLKSSAKKSRQNVNVKSSNQQKLVFSIPILIIVVLFLVAFTGNWNNTDYSYPEFEDTGILANKLATVYKSPTCGCCHKWVDYIQQNTDIELNIIDTPEVTSIKEKNNIPSELYSCHTMIIENYVIEGHVPVEAIVKLFSNQITAKGIAVPGMPSGSPGMGEDGSSYTVSVFDEAGNVQTFMKF